MARYIRFGRLAEHVLRDWVRTVEDRLSALNERTYSLVGFADYQGGDWVDGTLPTDQDVTQDFGLGESSYVEQLATSAQIAARIAFDYNDYIPNWTPGRIQDSPMLQWTDNPETWGYPEVEGYNTDQIFANPITVP